MTDLVRTDVPADFAKQLEMARYYADSTLLPSHLRGKPSNVLIILGGARSLGVSAFWALQSMHVIEGKLSLSAELMRGLAIRAGHRVRVLKREMDEAIVEIQRGDSDHAYQASFTWKEAVEAGLDKKDNWKKYRRAMLVARATSIAMRDECPDVLYGVVYTPDELGAMEGEDGSIMDGQEEAIPAQEVPELSDEDFVFFVKKVFDANAHDLIALAMDAKEGGILDRSMKGYGKTADQFLNRIMTLADAEDATEVDIRNLWKVASGLGLKDTNVMVRLRPEAEMELVALGLALEVKIKMIQEEAARLAQPEEPQDAEIIDDPDEVPPAETEEAQRLRQEAEASWN